MRSMSFQRKLSNSTFFAKRASGMAGIVIPSTSSEERIMFKQFTDLDFSASTAIKTDEREIVANYSITVNSCVADRVKEALYE